MTTKTLKTGVEITQDKNGTIVNLHSPYDHKSPSKMTVLRYYVKQIEQLIS